MTTQFGHLVGFANGCFDHLHDGHRHFLRECKMNCARLVVAINTDAYIREHKKREPESCILRAEHLLAYAHNVCVFEDEEGLLDLMGAFRPDVIFKGEDYYLKPVTGGHLARIHWVARHPGYGSSK